jgi:uncharacterized RDD family membrane protein YckC
VTRDVENDPTAVVGRRTGAWFIDVVLCGLAGTVAALLLADAYSLDRPSNGVKAEWVDGDLAIFVRDTVVVLTGSELAITAGCLTLAALLITVVVPGWRGWSPGGLAADVRLVNRQGEPPGVIRALVRNICWIIDGLPIIPLVGYITARRTFRHQRIGDLVAKTYVVDKRAMGRPVGAPPPRWDEPLDVVVRPAPEPEPIARPEPEPEPVRATESETEQPEQPAQPPSGVPLDQPIWDRRHKRYVLWHSKRRGWMEHVDDEWRPIEGGDDTAG